MKRRATKKQADRRLIKSPVPNAKKSRRTATSFYRLGVTKFSESKIREAIALLRVAIRYDKSFSLPCALLGVAYIALGRNRAGMKYCQKAIHLGYGDAGVWAFLAIGYGKIGKIGHARQVLNSAAKNFPDFESTAAECYSELFHYHWEERHLPAAKEALEELLTLQGTSDQWVAYSRCCLDLERYDLAFDAANRAVEINGHNGAAYSFRGLAAAKMKLYSAAILDLFYARRLNYTTGVTHNLKFVMAEYLHCARN